MTGVVVLGSTGSIGRQALEVLGAHRDRFDLVGIAAGRGSEELLAQARAHPGARVWCADGRPHELGEGRWAGGLEDLATSTEADVVLVATTGMSALPAVLAAIGAGRNVALANKETLGALSKSQLTAFLDSNI